MQTYVKTVLLFFLVLLVIGGIWSWNDFRGDAEKTPSDGDAPVRTAHQDANEVDYKRLEKLIEERQELDNTIWADEVTSQEYEQVFVDLWDRLRASQEKWKVLKSFPFEQLILGGAQETETKELGIQVTKYAGKKRPLSIDQWREILSTLHAAGIHLVQSEWHHERFETQDPNAIRSQVNMTLHVADDKAKRWIVKGTLHVTWAPRLKATDSPVPQIIDINKLTITQQEGKAAFRLAYKIGPTQLSPADYERIVMPVSTYDLDGDGLSEILVPGMNEVHWNRGNWRFEKQPLFTHPVKAPTSTLIADFTGDGRADVLAAAKNYVVLYVANSSGRFDTPPQLAAQLQKPLVNPVTMTAGDVDNDGDLDVWIGQYKLAFVGGQMATPYFDANDGFPAHLLHNNGLGLFEDVTVVSGLAEKRNRRTYSSALVDIDDDQDLDLVVCSDFAGLDVYRNDGKSNFTDVSEEIVDHRESFGMSLTFGDYNADGRVDFFMTGMGSTTARRLENLQCERKDFPKHDEMRQAMGYGNRMYLATDGGFKQAPFNDQLARTGWAWGATSFDFDNDGDVDVYVANGHVSRKTAKDYCTKFWRHDIYTGSSKTDPTINLLFQESLFSDPGLSWNGFEHNCLMLNENGQGYRNIGFLAGIAFEFDSRAVIGDDLDGDGRVDLIVFESNSMSGHPYDIHVLQNQLDTGNNWIGVRLAEEGKRVSPLGATVFVTTDGRRRAATLLCGDSFSSQHATTVHLGLGTNNRVDELEVVWANGSRLKIANPKTNQYHSISNPRGAPVTVGPN
jgi:hypothetical protein